MHIVSGLASEAPLGGSPLVASLLVLVGLLLGLRLYRRSVLRLRRTGERVLIIGRSPIAREIIEEIEQRPELRYTVAGVLDDAENLGRVVEATRPDRIVVALAERRGRLPLYQLLESRARGILVEDAVETYERLTSKLALEALSPSSVIFSREFQTSRLQLALSRVLSLLAAVVGVVALAPVLVLIGLRVGLPVVLERLDQDYAERAAVSMRARQLVLQHGPDEAVVEEPGGSIDDVERLRLRLVDAHTAARAEHRRGGDGGSAGCAVPALRRTAPEEVTEAHRPVRVSTVFRAACRPWLTVQIDSLVSGSGDWPNSWRPPGATRPASVAATAGTQVEPVFRWRAGHAQAMLRCGGRRKLRRD